ncbi:MAG: PP2C family serine/threonine-protein phosphatase [Bacteroidota bacterium]
MQGTILNIAALTDTGRVREINEDSFILCPDLLTGNWITEKVFLSQQKISKKGAILVVADGMGGMNAGEIASSIAIKAIQEYFSKTTELSIISAEEIKNHLISSVYKAHDEIVLNAKQNTGHKGMGTTIAIAWIFGNQVYVCWSGDSRIYIFCQNTGIKRLSKDHSYVQELVNKGKITEEQAFCHPESNIITQCLGDDTHRPDPGFTSFYLNSGDRILLCSDGLCGLLNDASIEQILKTENGTELCCGQLLAAANSAGGHDNITAILCDITETDVASDKNFNTKILSEKLPPKKNKRKILFFLFLTIVISLAIIFQNYIFKSSLKNIADTNKASDTSQIPESRQTLGNKINSDSLPINNDNTGNLTDEILKKIIIRLKQIDSIGGNLISDSTQQKCRIEFSAKLANLEKLMISMKSNSYKNINLTIKKLLDLKTLYPKDKKGNINLSFESAEKLYDELALTMKNDSI